MSVIPLKQLSYNDASDLRRIIDAINANFRYLDWLINSGNVSGNNIQNYSIPDVKIESVGLDKLVEGSSEPYTIVNEVLEYGALEYSAEGVTFIYEYRYTTPPVPTMGLVSPNPADFDGADFKFIKTHIIDGEGYYSGLEVYLKGASVPSSVTAGTQITLHAICKGLTERS